MTDGTDSRFACDAMLGGLARRIWNGAHVTDGLLEQQVSLGWGVIILALVVIVLMLTFFLALQLLRLIVKK